MGLLKEAKWEVINQGAGLARVKVHGGWIVKHSEVVRRKEKGILGVGEVQAYQMSICFMPDSEGKGSSGEYCGVCKDEHYRAQMIVGPQQWKYCPHCGVSILSKSASMRP